MIRLDLPEPTGPVIRRGRVLNWEIVVAHASSSWMYDSLPNVLLERNSDM